MRWTIKPAPAQEKVEKLAAELGLNKQLAHLLVQRNIETFQEAKIFFRPELNNLHDPFLMQDMHLAVKRIDNAIVEKEKILVYGDYDVDGTSAVALVSSYLKTLTQNVAIYIPDRYDEGYGVSFAGIDFAEDNEFDLIIALDCGIKAIDKVAYARKKGIDFIICDHHRPGNKLPEAVAVLDPKRADCHYPFDELCGCGIGFKLVQALATKRGQALEELKVYLDLVATAIAADIVPMNGENRILAHFGLEQINKAPRVGFKAIIDQINKKKLNITDVVFIIAPRINAAGRIKHGNQAVELMAETNLEQAQKFAAAIEEYNSNRKELDKKITDEALAQIKELQEEDMATTVVYKKDWHKGVIGIVASRLIETYYRPTLVFTKNKNVLAASARSVSGFDVYNALDACSEYIEQFGGHKYAAGLTIKPENYKPFKAAFEAQVKKTLPEDLKTPEIKIDQELDLEDLRPKFYRILCQFGPFGPQNMKPVFLSRQVKDAGYSRKVGEDEKHLKLSLTCSGGKKRIDGIGFGLGHLYDTISQGQAFDIVYSLDENTWNGNSSLQLVVKDIKISES